MTPESDDWLDRVLADEPYVPDDGFADRVMLALPPRRRSLRVPILAAAAALACVIAFVVFPGGAYLIGAVADVLRFGRAPTLAAVPVLSAALLALVVWGTAALALTGE